MLTQIRQFLAAPIFEDEDKTRAAGLLNTILLILAAVTLVIIPFLAVIDPATAMFNLAIGAVMVVIVLGLEFIMRRGYLRIASMLLASSLLVVVTATIYVFGGVRNNAATAYFLVVAIAALLLGARDAVVFGLLSMLAALGVFYAEINGVIVIPIPASVEFIDWLLLSAVLGMGTLLLRYAVRSIAEGLEQARQEIAERKRAEEKIEHLNLVLRAIRNVNQLITRERNRDRLLQGVCETLTETRGYHSAWIALLDESGGVVTSAEAGLGQDFLPIVERLKRNELFDCGQRALKQSGAVITQDPFSACADCSLSSMYRGRGAMTVRLEHGGKVYGLLSISIPRDLVADEEEHALFEEVAGDIAFALHNVELEEALAWERYLLRTLMDNAPDAIYFKDTDSRFIRTNKAHAERWFGLSDPAQAVGKTDFDFFSEEHAQQAYADEQKIVRTGQPLINIEEKETWPDGRVTWVSTTKMPLRDAEGHIIGTFGITRDITERKRAEEALMEERTLLRTVIDNLPDLIYAKDTESRFVIGNIAVARLMGATPDELLGKTDFDFYPQELAKQYYADEQEIIRSGQPLINREEPLMDQLTGRKGWLSTTKVPLRNSEGKIVGIVGVGQDITERKRTEEELAYMATHDALTGLPNRWLLNDRLTLELARAQRNRQMLALMLLDLDRFKDVNDTLGHPAGDKLLQVVGRRLRSLVRKSDTVARMGGDEFMLLLLFPGIRGEEDAAKIAQRILDAFRRPFVFDGHEMRITTSVGIAIYPDDGKDADTLIKNADIAMYRAKAQGRDNYQRYTPGYER